MNSGAGRQLREWTGIVLDVALRPRLWPVALSLVPSRWWKQRPPVPLPPAAYRRFREETMYGPGGKVRREDLLVYLEWCRRMRRDAR